MFDPAAERTHPAPATDHWTRRALHFGAPTGNPYEPASEPDPLLFFRPERVVRAGDTRLTEKAAISVTMRSASPGSEDVREVQNARVCPPCRREV